MMDINLRVVFTVGPDAISRELGFRDYAHTDPLPNGKRSDEEFWIAIIEHA